MKQIGLIALGIGLLVSCSKDNEVKTSDDKVIVQYLTENNIDFVKSSGVYKYSIVDNPSGSNSGNVFSIYYTLSDLISGTIIDSHLIGDGDPILLLHNASSVFPVGLDYGLTDVREGETIGIIVPGKLAYENYPSAAVSNDAILHFEVEVVSRQSQADIALSEDTDITNYISTNGLNPTMSLGGGVYYKELAAGTGLAPTSGDSLTIDYSGTFLDDSGFDALTGFKYKYGVGDVINALDDGIAEMTVNGRSVIIIPSEKAYGASVRVIPEAAIDDLVDQFVVPAYVARVPPFKVLIFDVTLQIIH